MLDDGHRQRPALDRIRAHRLVQEDERGPSSAWSIATMLAMWPEKVLRLWAMDCSSPMSAKTERNTGTCESSATGMSSPACARRGNRPAVSRATVFPPVFGPVMTRTFTGGISRMSTGTGSGGHSLRCGVGVATWFPVLQTAPHSGN